MKEKTGNLKWQSEGKLFLKEITPATHRKNNIKGVDPKMDEQIINDYQNNFLSIAQLKEKYHKSGTYITDVLKSAGININKTSWMRGLFRKIKKDDYPKIEKDIIDRYVNKHYGLIKTGKKYGLCATTVKKILKYNNIRIRNKAEANAISNVEFHPTYDYSKTKNYFKTQSHNMAWILGFIASNGNVNKKNNKVTITLALRDIEILEKIKQELQLDNPIIIGTTNSGFDICKLMWSCSEHKKDLSYYNIVPQKTFILQPPKKLKQQYIIDYIRGYFDGDGNVNERKNHEALRWEMCSANKSFLQWMIDFLYNNYNIPKVNIYVRMTGKNPFYYFSYSTRSTIKIYHALYFNNNSLCLKRKKDKFDKLISFYE